MITRRDFLRRGAAISGLASAGGIGALLAACGGAAAPPAARPGAGGRAAGGSPAGGAGAGARAITVILGAPTLDPSFSYLSVGQELGFYRQEGLDPSFIPSQGTEQAAQQVAAGQAQLGMPAPDPVLQGYQPGKDLHLKWVYTVYQGFIFDLTVPEESPIRTVADLRGKTVGVSSLASDGNAAVQAAVRAAGLSPKDVTVVATGVAAQAAAALRSHRVDALALWDAADAVISSLGIRLRKLPTPEFAKLFANGVICAPGQLGDAAGRAMLTGFCRALAKGTVWTLANPEAAVRIHYRRYPQSKPAGKSDAQALRDGLSELRARLPNLRLPAGVTEWGWNDRARWQEYERFMLDAGLLKSPVDVRQVYTNELLADVNRFDAAAIRQQAQAYRFQG